MGHIAGAGEALQSPGINVGAPHQDVQLTAPASAALPLSGAPDGWHC
jgi:hypothetical protein